MEEIKQELVSIRNYFEDNGYYDVVSDVDLVLDKLSDVCDEDEGDFDLIPVLSEFDLDLMDIINKSEMPCPELSRYLLSSMC